MRYRTLIVAFGILALCVSASHSELKPSTPSGKEPFLPERIAELRSQGPEGLRVALQFLNVDPHSSEFQGVALGIADGPLKQKCEAIEQVAGQRYGYLSRLFWYDDWNAAVAQAKLTQKPILVLKMLGKLTDELSCANSRFFRTALYVDPRISDYLREHYVLCWSSVRPVPKITIEFGEGRKMIRTITGNSAHYVVTADGLVLDALPGMVGPQMFLDWIVRMDQLFQNQAQIADRKEAIEVLRRYHLNFEVVRLDISTNPDNSTNRIVTGSKQIVTNVSQLNPVVQAKIPRVRDNIAISKTFVEQPMVQQVIPGQSEVNAIVEDTRRFQGPESSAGVELSATSLALIAAENATSKVRNGDAESMKRLLANFQQSIAADEKQNEQVFHKTIHAWLAETPQIELELLNKRIYDQLFAMPSDDPWLGLASSDYYSGLCRGGLYEDDR